jgi:ribonuclease-3
MTPDERIEAALGYQFRDRELFTLALTHRSAGKAGRADRQHNERLESEDALSIVRASLVRKETLATMAATLGLGDAIRLGTGERQSGGHKRPSILANALEALIGAVFLDGGHEAAGALVDRLYGDRLVTASADAAKDAKTRLQEYLQGQNQALPVYAVERVSGLAHARVFSVSCRVPAWDLCISAQGTSRRAAEIAAAGRALDEVQKRGL